MNILTNLNQRARFGVLQGAIAIALLMGGAEAKAACTVGNPHFLSTPVSAPHEGFSEGSIIMSTGHQAPVLDDCDRYSGADLSIETSLGYVGEVDDVPTFATSHSAIGAQFRYRYLEVAQLGKEEWSSWFNLDDKRRDFHAKAVFSRDIPQTALPVAVEVYFVALRDIGGHETIQLEDLAPAFQLEDRTYGQDLDSATTTGFIVRPKRYAYCAFSRAPPSTQPLAPTTISMLKAEGDLGPAVDFSFSWSCAAGDDRGGGADFQFLSDKALGTTDGLLAVEGSAKGVDMLVTMKDKSGGQMPVPLGTHWWATYHFHRGNPLPNVGSQDMQVRFRRNKDELKPGDATSTMTVRLSLF
ncbi:TPA: hypothetical protein UOA93_000270 [Stenotrophomonas maltophilia]|nr:hypothetical protein [Stenotrophomonas maltophilia]